MANKNSNSTLSLMLSEAAKIAAAHKAAPSPEHVQEMHDLHENAKQVLSREEYAVLWESIKPKASGVADFAGRGWKRNHPEAPASAMPKHITEAQEKRKAEKAAAPAKQEKPKTTKAAAPAKQEKPKTTKEKAPTYTETLLAVVACLERMDKRLESIDNRLSRVEKKLGK